MLQPLVRRTWAPVGQRPVMYCWDRRDRLSVIGGLTVSARRRHLGLYFAIHSHNVKTEEVEAFVRQVQRQVGRPLVVILDRLAAHKSAAKLLEADERQRFQIEWLPSYAPDLNPVEPVWSKTKYGDLANFVPGDVLDLEIAAESTLTATQGQQPLLRSFFEAAELTI
jgi:transposase